MKGDYEIDVNLYFNEMGNEEARRLMEQSNNNRFVPKYTIGVTVRLTSIEPHRIRKYERYDLVCPARTESGQRLYCDADLDKLKQISQLEEQGVNMQGVKLILSMTEERKSGTTSG